MGVLPWELRLSNESEQIEMSAENESTVRELVAEAKAAGVTELDLDEIVHDLADRAASRRVNSDGADFDQAHDEASVLASTVNNSGLEGQITWIVAQVGADEARRLIL